MQLTELYDKPGHLIRRAQQIAVAIFTQECRDLDITPAQYEILLAVRSQPGIDATHLSQLVALDRSSLASALDRLERKNLILRHTDAHAFCRIIGESELGFVAGCATYGRITGQYRVLEQQFPQFDRVVRQVRPRVSGSYCQKNSQSQS